jgi:hypothetical protein
MVHGVTEVWGIYIWTGGIEGERRGEVRKQMDVPLYQSVKVT